MIQNKKNNFVEIGKIVNTHSLRGEVRILSDSLIEERFHKDNIIFYWDKDNQLKELKIESARPHKNFILLKFYFLDSINEVEFLKNTIIFGNKEKLDIDEFYFQDIIGYEVFENNIYVGKIIDFLNQKIYDSFLIETSNKKTINIPILDNFIEKVDKKTQKIFIKYLDNNYEN